MRKPMIVAITGASGVIYGVRLVQTMLEAKQPICLVLSEAARLVIREELGISLKSLSRLEDLTPILGLDELSGDAKDLIEVYAAKDFTAPIASGSFPTAGMVIVPCTMGTLGAVANGISQNLIHRAADCTLKEDRKLVLVPRETPLNAIHLENMLKLSRAGAKIVPAMPGFYSGAKSLEEVIDFMVGKILDQFEISHVLYPRWTGLSLRSLAK